MSARRGVFQCNPCECSVCGNIFCFSHHTPGRFTTATTRSTTEDFLTTNLCKNHDASHSAPNPTWHSTGLPVGPYRLSQTANVFLLYVKALVDSLQLRLRLQHDYGNLKPFRFRLKGNKITANVSHKAISVPTDDRLKQSSAKYRPKMSKAIKRCFDTFNDQETRSPNWENFILMYNSYKLKKGHRTRGWGKSWTFDQMPEQLNRRGARNPIVSTAFQRNTQSVYGCENNNNLNDKNFYSARQKYSSE